MTHDVTRRRFMQQVAALGAASALQPQAHADQHDGMTGAEDEMPIGDEQWSLWLDQKAAWEKDEIFLPGQFDLRQLPVNPPSGGWQALRRKTREDGYAEVTLPVTVEQHFWGVVGKRSYTPDEYRYAATIQCRRTEHIAESLGFGAISMSLHPWQEKEFCFACAARACVRRFT